MFFYIACEEALRLLLSFGLLSQLNQEIVSCLEKKHDLDFET